MTLNQYRRFDRAQETLVRAMMPRTNAADPSPLPAFAAAEVPSRVRWSLGRRYVQKEAFTLAEVAHA